MKKAVLLATGVDLSTVSDARAMRQLLVERFGYDASNIRLLHHERSRRDPLYASRGNVRGACAWLVRDARPGDSLLFYYSGHASDTMIEVCHDPCGVEPHMISGERLREWLVAPLCAGVKLHVMLDTCHAGGLMPQRFTMVPRLKRDGRTIRRCDVVQRYDAPRRKQKVPVVIVIAACMATQYAHEVRANAVSAPVRGAAGYGSATYALRRVTETYGSRLSYGEFYARMVLKMLEDRQTPRVYSNVSFDPHKIVFRL